ncbi:MAG: hypothetical protein ACLFP2_04420, partial [Candidatus Woesearchaeota archaeon]
VILLQGSTIFFLSIGDTDTSVNFLNFNRSEKDKARRYIQQANQSEAIRKFSGMLNAYITFCNRYDLSNFQSFVETLYNYKPWEGSVVLFEIESLLKLYI